MREVISPAPTFWKVAHASACQQVPLREKNVSLAVIVARNPFSQQPKFFAHRAAPFGATAAVYGYNRLACVFVHIARVVLQVPIGNSLDDLGGISIPACSESSYHTFRALDNIFGIAITESTCVPPSSRSELFGCSVVLSRRTFALAIAPPCQADPYLC